MFKSLGIVSSAFCLLFVALVRAQTNPACPKDWGYFAKSNKCLKVFGTGSDEGPPKTWSMAEEYCNRFNGGHLAALKSEDEITFLVELTHATGFDDGDLRRIFIGLSYSGSSGWGHSDGSSLTYLRWYTGGTLAFDGPEDGRYPSGILFTRRKLTGYMFANDNPADTSWTAPFVCQSIPANEGRK